MRRHISLLLLVLIIGLLTYGWFSEEVIARAKPFLVIAVVICVLVYFLFTLKLDKSKEGGVR